MACSDYAELLEFWKHGAFFDGVYCAYANSAVGGEFATFMVFATFGLSLYAYSRQPLILITLGILLGGIFVVELPPAIIMFATFIGVVGTAAVLYLLARQTRRGPI